MRNAVFLLAIVLGTLPATIEGQGPATDLRPSFEVAFIKENRSGATDWSFGAEPGGRWSMVNRSIAALIREAYPVQVPELLGAPDWVTSVRFDVTAKGEGSPTRAEIRQMLQSLLADRFNLAVHYESREGPVFALIIARADRRLGAGLRPSPLDCEAVDTARRAGRQPEGPLPANGAPPCGISLQAGTSEILLFGGRPISTLTEWLRQPSGRVVIDQTGLMGNYELTLRYTSDLNAVDAPSIFTALEEQLGLKLVPDRAPLQMLVVDHIDRPTPD